MHNFFISLTFILWTWINAIIVAANGQQLYPDVTKGGRSHYPGVRLTLSPDGVNRISEAVCFGVGQSTENMPLQPIDVSFLIIYQISFSDMRISRYRSTNGHQCRVTTKTPNKFVLSVRNVDMVVKAVVSGGVFIFNTRDSDYTAHLNGVSYEISVSLERFRGYPRFKFLGCRATISHATHSASGGSGLVRRALNSFRGRLTRTYKRHLEAQLSNSYKKVIRAVNEEIERLMPHRMSLWSAKRLYYDNDGGLMTTTTNQNSVWWSRGGAQFSTNRNAAGRGVPAPAAQIGTVAAKIENGMKNLHIDNSLIRNPEVNNAGSVTLDMKGEISWQGHGRTPFYPNSPDLNDKQGKMVQVILSDYVVNSMLYHAHRNGLLRLRIGPSENSQLAKVLFNRQCSDLMCLGEHLPQIYNSYRQDSLEMAVEFSKAPAAVISSDKILMHLDGHVTLRGQRLNSKHGAGGSKSVEIVKVQFDAQALIKLTVTPYRADTLNATVNVQRVKTKLSNKAKNLLIKQEDIDDLVTFGTPLIEHLLVHPFSDAGGMPIPRTKYGKLKNLHNRKLAIESDLDLNAHEFANFAKRVLKSG